MDPGAGSRTIEASSSSARGGELFERRQLEERRVGADLGIEVRADAAEGLVHRERVEIAAAFIEQIAGDGGEARLMPGILRRADRHQHETGDERYLVVLDGADAQAVGQRAPPDFGKVETERRTGLRQPCAIDRHQAHHRGLRIFERERGAAFRHDAQHDSCFRAQVSAAARCRAAELASR